jgi:Predicted ATP-dependent endonuclease of the OLD family
MRLIKAEFKGFGRLADAKVNLDNKVIAIVGPNEAGKTTLLKALAYIDNGRSLSVSERSRGTDVVADGQIVVRVQHLLDDADRELVRDLDLEELPKSLWLSRTAAGGDVIKEVVPTPRKAVAPLRSALAALKKSATKSNFDALAPVVPDEEADTEVDSDEARLSFATRLADAINAVDPDVEAATLPGVGAGLNPAAWLAEFDAFDLAGPIRDALEPVRDWVERPDPAAEVEQRLFDESADLLLFGDEDRTLNSTYALSDEVVANPPAALRNLATMADLPLDQLWMTINNGDEGARETHIEKANQALSAKFKTAWKQSTLTVQLKIEGSTLAIRIKQDGNTITQFHERSAGLQMFVALVAFLTVKGQTVPPVLLIDEAETHLHIDAQADLVNTFMTQQQAAKIIYTTHSPACLPPDLGSNIRAVLPDKKNGQRSVIEGSFWHGAAGFSPLMLAMGAGAAAFSAARRVVLAEGASEMLLMPSLVKAAIAVADLDYQVAPGLSEVPATMYPELDLEGARVAFLVDGDHGGLAIKDALVKSGVSEKRIVTLGTLTLENLLDPVAYRTVIANLINDANPSISIQIDDVPELPDPSSNLWPDFVENWAKDKGYLLPGKRAVASKLVEEGLATPSDYGRPILVEAHKQLTALLAGKKQS